MGFPAALFLVLALLLGACSGPGGNHPPQIAAFPLEVQLSYPCCLFPSEPSAEAPMLAWASMGWYQTG